VICHINTKAFEPQLAHEARRRIDRREPADTTSRCGQNLVDVLAARAIRDANCKPAAWQANHNNIMSSSRQAQLPKGAFEQRLKGLE
jgi:hypothetical protein